MTFASMMWLQSDSSAAAGLMGTGMMLFGLAVSIVFIAAAWKIFAKAGQPGWATVVPIYGAYIVLRIVGRPTWWLILLLIPIVNIVPLLIVAMDLAKSFGQSAAFGVVLLFFFSFIGILILGFGSAQYVGPAAAPQQARAAAV